MGRERRTPEERNNRIGAKKQVTERATQQIGDPPLRQMVRTIVNHVALTRAAEIAQPVVARIVIEVRRGQNDTGLAHLRCFHEIGPSGGPAAVIALGVPSGVEPTPVG